MSTTPNPMADTAQETIPVPRDALANLVAIAAGLPPDAGSRLSGDTLDDLSQSAIDLVDSKPTTRRASGSTGLAAQVLFGTSH